MAGNWESDRIGNEKGSILRWRPNLRVRGIWEGKGKDISKGQSEYKVFSLLQVIIITSVSGRDRADKLYDAPANGVREMMM